jgi:hypothetical protein
MIYLSVIFGEEIAYDSLKDRKIGELMVQTIGGDRAEKDFADFYPLFGVGRADNRGRVGGDPR